MKPCALLRRLPRPSPSRAAREPFSRTYSHAGSDGGSPSPRGRLSVLEDVKERLRRDHSEGTITIDAENRTVDTAAGKLPLSPVMDPTWVDAMQRHKQRKANPKAHPTGRFRRKLANNIYAQMLASPVRNCAMTRTRLPRDFLQEFRPVLEPTTQQPWWMPAEMARETTSTPSSSPSPPEGAVAPPPDDTTTAIVKGSRGPVGYLLAHQSVTTPPPRQTNFRHAVSRSLTATKPWKMNQMPGNGPPVWRDGMNEILLDMMRRDAAAGLRELARLVDAGDNKPYLVPLRAWDEVDAQKFRGCILWWGPEEPPTTAAAAATTETAVGEPEATSSDGSPSFYSTYDVEGVRFGAKIPVHNLRVVLGPAHFAELRAASPIFRDTHMALLARVRSTRVQKLLWRIQGYMAV